MNSLQSMWALGWGKIGLQGGVVQAPYPDSRDGDTDRPTGEGGGQGVEAPRHVWLNLGAQTGLGYCGHCAPEMSFSVPGG